MAEKERETSTPGRESGYGPGGSDTPGLPDTATHGPATITGPRSGSRDDWEYTYWERDK